MPTSLITGAAGLLGQCLIERLAPRGDRLRLLDMAPLPAPSPHEFVAADMRDANAVAAACRDVEIVYHLAAGQRMKPQFAIMSEQAIFDMNLAAVRNVLAGAKAAGVRKVVHISSSGIYGIPQTNPVTEAHPQQPLGAYGRSKIAAEAACREALDAGLDVTAMRPMSMFGPGMTGVFLLLFDWVRQGKNVYLLGGGHNRVQMVSAYDVADACILATDRPQSRGAFLNLGAAEVPSVRQQVAALIAHAGTGSRLIAFPAALVRTAGRLLNVVNLSPIVPEHYLLADSTFVLDTQRARDVLGWVPRFTNVTMTTAAYDWYCQHWQQVRGTPGLVLRMLNALS